MDITVDRTPPPTSPPTLRGSLRQLKVGESLLAPRTCSIYSLRVAVSVIKREHPNRRFSTARTPDGPRAWRHEDSDGKAPDAG